MAQQPQTAGSPRSPVWLDRASPPHVVTLVLFTGVAALNLNVILPSLPSIADYFSADYGVVTLAVSGYLALTAALQLVLGPLSDRYGRRPVLIGGFAVFLVATVGCVLAPNLGVFLAFRMLQATVATGIALSRAIVRDMVPPNEAASLIGYVTMGMSLMPMIGPMIGGVLDEAFGWQSIFIATFLVGALVLALIWADLGETNRTQSQSFAAQFRAYPELVRSRRFWGYAATATLASGAFFAFLGGGPWVADHVLGLSPSGLGLYFALMALGYMLGNFLSGRYAGAMGLNRMMVLGGLVGTAGTMLTIGLFAAGFVSPLTFFGPIFFVGAGNGLLLPSANAGLVSVRPELAGSASGLGSAMMIGAGAVLASVTGALLGPETGAWPLLWMMFATSALCILSALDVMRAGRGRGV